ncbi:MAG TPA: M20/M25/M40 family metallo-hydrolase, partial [Candidatus Binataceae bacterium]|nr:M20/M25/M40 family metallo-hydrolase [Candidatus Binataceae bacterium]
TAMWLHIVADGQAGHAAAPPAETSVTRLVRALARLIDYRSPIRVIGPVQQEYHVLAELGQGPSQWLDLDTSIQDATFARQFLAVPSQNAKVRNTIAPTVLSGSQKTNVIPAIAYADVDCRLLPGEDSKQFLKTIKKVIGDDSVKVEVKLNFPPASSPQKSTLMTAIEKLAKDYDKAQVTPIMISGFTDSRYFRHKDVVAYGFIPLEAGKEEFEGVHGIDERIQIKHLGDAIHRMVDLLEQFGGVRKAP